MNSAARERQLSLHSSYMSTATEIRRLSHDFFVVGSACNVQNLQDMETLRILKSNIQEFSMAAKCGETRKCQYQVWKSGFSPWTLSVVTFGRRPPVQSYAQELIVINARHNTARVYLQLIWRLGLRLSKIEKHRADQNKFDYCSETHGCVLDFLRYAT